MRDSKITSMPYADVGTPCAKEAVLLDFGVRAASRTGSKVLAQCAKTADITKVSCERGWAFRGEDRYRVR